MTRMRLSLQASVLVAVPVFALVPAACSDEPASEHAVGPQVVTVPLSTAGRVLVTDALSRLVPSLQGGVRRDALGHELLTLLEESVPVNGDLPVSRWVGDRDEVGADAADLAAIALVVMALERERTEPLQKIPGTTPSAPPGTIQSDDRR